MSRNELFPLLAIALYLTSSAVAANTTEFLEAPQYNVSSFPESGVAGDFNGDGKLDLAVTSADKNSVSVLFGNGDGTFQASVDYSTGTFPVGSAAVDVNGDGKLDLLVPCLLSNGVSVLLGNGNGTFQPHVDY